MMLLMITFVHAENSTNQSMWNILRSTLDISVQQPILQQIDNLTAVDAKTRTDYLSLYDNLKGNLFTSIASEGQKRYMDKDNAEKAMQLGIEESFHDAELGIVLANTNIMWTYVILVFQLISDLVLTLFYVLEFALLVYILFEFIPKLMLMLRDGMTKMIVNQYKKKGRREDERG